MLTRFVRIQLTIFTIASTVGVLVMIFSYLQAPTLLGVGRITVTLELPAAGGLYRFSNVTYRGVQVGKVTSVGLTSRGPNATLSLDTSPRIPADLQAEVRSISAVGEQYVDLRPRTDSGPYLEDGSVIPAHNTTIPQAVGPMLDQVSALINSIPKDKLSGLLDESFNSLNGAGYDLGSLFDSSAKVVGEINGVADPTRTLVNDAAPLLDSQADSTDALKTWARSLAGITGQVAADDTQVRALLRTGPGAANEVSQLLNQVKPTLPVLLANLTTIGQVAVTYHPSLQQLLVLLPPSVASTQAFGLSRNNPTGFPLGDFAVSLGDPPACTVGFLPPSQWRSPADTSTIDTPDDLYCKLPQDSPIVVRGARNYPCMGHPGKRAPTVEICDSDKPYEPLAMRQHALGPYPLDPNLIAQGIAPDDRATLGDNIFAPVQGTPMPPGGPAPPASLSGPQNPAAPAAGPAVAPGPADVPPSPPGTAPPPPGPDDGAAPAAPSSYGTGPGSRPSVAVAEYNPRTGMYITPDGQINRQSNLVTGATPKTWKDMLPS
jgi:virulence factor Mce-like protein